MNDWPQWLIDWMGHQDYGWFLAILVWCGVLVGAWGRGTRHEGRKGWLMWIAGSGVIQSSMHLALYANNYAVSYFWWDFSLGAAQAVGLAALWWPLMKRIKHPQLCRALTVLAGLGLSLLRINTPVLGGFAIAWMAAGGVWTAVRGLGESSPRESRCMKAGLFMLALLPLVSTVGPFAYALHAGRRTVDFSLFELPSVTAHIFAAGLFAVSLWAPRLRPAPRASESAAQRWSADLRLGFTILAVWLELGLVLTVAGGRRSRHAFEQSLLLRARTAAALLDQDTLQSAFRAAFNEEHAERPQKNFLDILQRQLNQLRLANSDLASISITGMRNGKVTRVAGSGDPPQDFAEEAVEHGATPPPKTAFASSKVFFAGPFRDERGAHFSAIAPILNAENSQPIGWLTMTVPAKLWAAPFARARLQAMAVTAVGVAMWVLAVIYRLRHTERELALEHAEHSAAADRAKSEFLAQVSHELRAPLQGIYGYTDLLEMTPLNPHQRELLASLRAQGGLMLRLANDLLDLGALQAGAFRLNPETVELHALVGECVDSVRLRAENKGLKISFTVEQRVPQSVRTDGARVRQVLLNLLSNAVKYTLEGEVRLQVQCCQPPAAGHGVMPEWARSGSWVEFAVIDTGLGIAPEDQERIFQPFIRLERGASEEGLGLGLALTGCLSRAMGGSVQVESDGQNGSNFIVRLPLGQLDKTFPRMPDLENKLGERVANL